jgi:hypothetical protein
MKRAKRSPLPNHDRTSPAAESIAISHLLPYLEGDGEADAAPVSTHYRESWRRFFATAFAALLLIGTEEGARAAFEHPAAVSSGHHGLSRNSHRLHEKPKCKSCGTIVSKREVDYGGKGLGDAAASGDGQTQLATFYQFTLREPDGSLRVITTTNAEAWREGERVSVIEGAKLPNNKHG